MLKSDPEQVQTELHHLWLQWKNGQTVNAGIPMPPTLALLEPHFVEASDGQVRFELGGAECHYGFEQVEDAAALTDRETCFRNMFPSKEIRPGLWFYAEWGLP
ncbi:MAG TPA: hypothetical protein VF595_15885 [Tepidisphaeraceae bacterium]